MILGWPMNQSEYFVEVKNLLTYEELDLDCLAHNLVTIPHIQMNTLFMYFFGCQIGQHVGRKQRRFWQQPQNVSHLKFSYRVPTPYAEPMVPSYPATCSHYCSDEGGWEMPKVYTDSYMKSNWSKTEIFKNK
jgi:hypothetical protein